MYKKIVFIILFSTTFISSTHSQCRINEGFEPEYSIRKYNYDDHIRDMYLSPNFGLFVSSGSKLKLFDGKSTQLINHLSTNDTNNSGIVFSFLRNTKYSIYYQTNNYLYRLSSKLDTLPVHDIEQYFYSYPKFNPINRIDNYSLFPEKEALSELIFKRKSGLIIGKSHIENYNFPSNTLKLVHEFPRQKILFYINFNNTWFIFTQNETYKATLFNSGQVKTEKINDPLPNLRNGNVFYRNHKYFLINNNGLSQINFQNGIWSLNYIIDAKRDYIPLNIFHFEISEDYKDIFFIEKGSTYLYHYKRYNACGIKMNSLNSMFIAKNKIYANNFSAYSFETNTVTNDSLIANYSNDYSKVGDNLYLTNFNDTFFSYFDESLKLKHYANVENILWSRFVKYKGKIYGTSHNKIFYLENGKTVYVRTNNKGLLIDFTFCYSLLIKNNQLFLATDKGVFIYDFETHIIKKQADIPAQDIRTIVSLKDKESIIAFSYGKGPYIIEKNIARKLPIDREQNLLFAHNLVIHDSLAYISSNNGVYIIPLSKWISKSQNNITPFYRIDSLDGLPVNECNSGSNHTMLLDSVRNNILIATTKGIGIIPLNQTNIFWPTVLPKIIATSYSNHHFFGCKDTLSNYSNLELKVSIPYFGNPLNANIEFRIVGIFENWSNLKDGSIYLPDNLYGEYKIELRVNNGFDSYLTKSYYMYFEPKWYQTNWFKFVTSILGFMAIFLFISIFRRTERLKRRKIQALVDKKTLELNNALISMENINSELVKSESIKENLVNVLAHDMRSPLMSILYTVDFLVNSEKMSNGDIEKLELLNEVKSSISQIAQFSTEFLKWYATNKVGFKLSISNQNLNDLILPTISIYEPIIKRSNNQIKTGLLDNIVIGIDKELFKIVFRNLLDNANKYCDGEIIVESYYDGNEPILVVKNNIKPMNEFDFKSMQRRLESNTNAENEGFKFGLSLIAKMAVTSNIKLNLIYENDWLIFTLKFNQTQKNINKYLLLN